MGHTAQPHEGHHLLLNDIRGRCGRATLAGISEVEQIAILSQAIGGLIHDLDGRQYDVAEVMQSVSRNIMAGNAAVGGQTLIGIGKAS